MTNVQKWSKSPPEVLMNCLLCKLAEKQFLLLLGFWSLLCVQGDSDKLSAALTVAWYFLELAIFVMTDMFAPSFYSFRIALGITGYS